MKQELAAAKYALRRLCAVVTTAIIVVLSWNLIASYGPLIDARFFPVYRGAFVSDYRVIGRGMLSVQIEFDKTRPCRLAELSWYTIDQTGQPVLLARQEQETDPATVHVEVSGDHVDFVGMASHSCGWLWTSRSVLGPIRVTVDH